MQLLRLLTRLNYSIIQGTAKQETGKVTNDTREMNPGDVFVCIEGYTSDGHQFAREAARKGASAIVIQKEIETPKDVTVIRVTDSRYALAVMSAAFYGYPAEKLKIIGITGTKGKSTTAWMTWQLLKKAGHKTGLIGTIQIDTGSRVVTNRNTTPESCQIQQYLFEMAENGCDSVVMEVSSQGLKYGRTAGIPFEAGVFTNLGRDHIGPGEHADMEEYRQCKHLLFQQCKVGIGNVDDPEYEAMFDRTNCRRVTFGQKKGADFRASEIRSITETGYMGSEFRIEGSVRMPVELPMPGLFNIYNALGAIAAARELYVSEDTVFEGLVEMKVPGRMELVKGTKGAAIFIDYAHNAMSLASVLRTLRECGAARIIVVFGCGGLRSRDRRYEMGETAGRLADMSVITTDNPREEEPEAIIADIITGIKRTDGAYTAICDRGEAICYAIKNSRPDDVILIAGKGHETYQEIKGIRYAMDDRALVKQCMQI